MVEIAPHWIPFHDYNPDAVARCGSKYIKVLDPNTTMLEALRAHDLRIVVRLSNLSTPTLSDNPESVAVQHVEFCALQFTSDLVDYYESYNEPFSLLDPRWQEWWARYFVAFIKAARQWGLTPVWGNFSTGTPPGRADVGAADWTPYAEALALSEQTSAVLGLHEYWNPNRPFESCPWHAGRFRFVPARVRIFITEAAVNYGVADPDPTPRGWRVELNEQQYARQLQWYRDMCAEDSRVESVFVFTHDYASNDWASFDTRGLEDEIRALNEQPVPVKPAPTSPTTTTPSHFLHELRRDIDRALEEIEKTRQILLRAREKLV